MIDFKEVIIFNSVERFFKNPSQALKQKSNVKKVYNVNLNIKRTFDKVNGQVTYELQM